MEMKTKEEKKANRGIFEWWGAWTSLIILLTVPYWFTDSDSHLIWGNNWSYFFISMAGIMKAVMDTLQFHYEHLRFNLNEKFWNPEFSWINKYHTPFIGQEFGTYKRKKVFGLIPLPVMFTDGWHLFQSFQITFMCMAIVTYASTWNVVIDFLAYSFLYRAFFFLFYKYFLIKR